MKKYSQLIRHSGNEALFEMLNLSATGAYAGTPVHIHAEGFRGTGKTTVIRAYKDVLPKITRIKGCLYNCDPQKPHCPSHRDKTQEEIQKLGVEQINMPFLEISPSAKKATVVGSIDLKKLTSKTPEAAVLLGTIPKAHRGIIFIDEINRIADTSPEIADVLLDVMGTKPGRIQIEEVGFPVVEMPISASIWAASNPDEDPGPLEVIRRQLSDRFDFCVNVDRPLDFSIIKNILDDRCTLSKNKKVDLPAFLTEEVIKKYCVSEELRSLLAHIYVEFGLESLRGVEAILLGSQIRGALNGRNADYRDMIFVARHALRHRVDNKSLQDILNRIEENSRQPVKAKTSEALCAGNKAMDASVIPPKDEKRENKSLNFIEKILSYFKKRTGGEQISKKKDQRAPSVDPKYVNFKAPPKKAIAIKELEAMEYVKTEEELFP